ncbi:hypothetical protein KIPB_000388 [Kipferlia bialata]|uniref:CCR4-Not complex component Not1 C-terminal domain-containing protein n=1 Tax=Kipferlia bialata TaxID=797122 RepID=A0A9K3GEX6_9EUKA|nr:hypothetical protein KIPB_000388 [Kipferlia bialata]|eukprot:g388.t1
MERPHQHSVTNISNHVSQLLVSLTRKEVNETEYKAVLGSLHQMIRQNVGVFQIVVQLIMELIFLKRSPAQQRLRTVLEYMVTEFVSVEPCGELLRAGMEGMYMSARRAALQSQKQYQQRGKDMPTAQLDRRVIEIMGRAIQTVLINLTPSLQIVSLYYLANSPEQPISYPAKELLMRVAHSQASNPQDLSAPALNALQAFKRHRQHQGQGQARAPLTQPQRQPQQGQVPMDYSQAPYAVHPHRMTPSPYGMVPDAASYNRGAAQPAVAHTAEKPSAEVLVRLVEMHGPALTRPLLQAVLREYNQFNLQPIAASVVSDMLHAVCLHWPKSRQVSETAVSIARQMSFPQHVIDQIAENDGNQIRRRPDLLADPFSADLGVILAVHEMHAGYRIDWSQVVAQLDRPGLFPPEGTVQHMEEGVEFMVNVFFASSATRQKIAQERAKHSQSPETAPQEPETGRFPLDALFLPFANADAQMKLLIAVIQLTQHIAIAIDQVAGQRDLTGIHTRLERIKVVAEALDCTGVSEFAPSVLMLVERERRAAAGEVLAEGVAEEDTEMSLSDAAQAVCNGIALPPRFTHLTFLWRCSPLVRALLRMGVTPGVSKDSAVHKIFHKLIRQVPMQLAVTLASCVPNDGTRLTDDLDVEGQKLLRQIGEQCVQAILQHHVSYMLQRAKDQAARGGEHVALATAEAVKAVLGFIRERAPAFLPGGFCVVYRMSPSGLPVLVSLASDIGVVGSLVNNEFVPFALEATLVAAENGLADIGLVIGQRIVLDGEAFFKSVLMFLAKRLFSPQQLETILPRDVIELGKLFEPTPHSVQLSPTHVADIWRVLEPHSGHCLASLAAANDTTTALLYTGLTQRILSQDGQVATILQQRQRADLAAKELEAVLQSTDDICAALLDDGLSVEEAVQRAQSQLQMDTESEGGDADTDQARLALNKYRTGLNLQILQIMAEWPSNALEAEEQNAWSDEVDQSMAEMLGAFYIRSLLTPPSVGMYLSHMYAFLTAQDQTVGRGVRLLRQLASAALFQQRREKAQASVAPRPYRFTEARGYVNSLLRLSCVKADTGLVFTLHSLIGRDVPDRDSDNLQTRMLCLLPSHALNASALALVAAEAERAMPVEQRPKLQGVLSASKLTQVRQTLNQLTPDNAGSKARDLFTLIPPQYWVLLAEELLDMRLLPQANHHPQLLSLIDNMGSASLGDLSSELPLPQHLLGRLGTWQKSDQSLMLPFSRVVRGVTFDVLSACIDVMFSDAFGESLKAKGSEDKKTKADRRRREAASDVEAQVTKRLHQIATWLSVSIIRRDRPVFRDELDLPMLIERSENATPPRLALVVIFAKHLLLQGKENKIIRPTSSWVLDVVSRMEAAIKRVRQKYPETDSKTHWAMVCDINLIKSEMKGLSTAQEKHAHDEEVMEGRRKDVAQEIEAAKNEGVPKAVHTPRRSHVQVPELSVFSQSAADEAAVPAEPRVSFTPKPVRSPQGQDFPAVPMARQEQEEPEALSPHSTGIVLSQATPGSIDVVLPSIVTQNPALMLNGFGPASGTTEKESHFVPDMYVSAFLLANPGLLRALERLKVDALRMGEPALDRAAAVAVSTVDGVVQGNDPRLQTIRTNFVYVFASSLCAASLLHPLRAHVLDTLLLAVRALPESMGLVGPILRAVVDKWVSEVIRELGNAAAHVTNKFSRTDIATDRVVPPRIAAMLPPELLYGVQPSAPRNDVPSLPLVDVYLHILHRHSEHPTITEASRVKVNRARHTKTFAEFPYLDGSSAQSVSVETRMALHQDSRFSATNPSFFALSFLPTGPSSSPTIEATLATLVGQSQHQQGDAWAAVGASLLLRRKRMLALLHDRDTQRGTPISEWTSLMGQVATANKLSSQPQTLSVSMLSSEHPILVSLHKLRYACNRWARKTQAVGKLAVEVITKGEAEAAAAGEPGSFGLLNVSTAVSALVAFRHTRSGGICAQYGRHYLEALVSLAETEVAARASTEEGSISDSTLCHLVSALVNEGAVPAKAIDTSLRKHLVDALVGSAVPPLSLTVCVSSFVLNTAVSPPGSQANALGLLLRCSHTEWQCASEYLVETAVRTVEAVSRSRAEGRPPPKVSAALCDVVSCLELMPSSALSSPGSYPLLTGSGQGVAGVLGFDAVLSDEKDNSATIRVRMVASLASDQPALRDAGDVFSEYVHAYKRMPASHALRHALTGHFVHRLQACGLGSTAAKTSHIWSHILRQVMALVLPKKVTGQDSLDSQMDAVAALAGLVHRHTADTLEAVSVSDLSPALLAWVHGVTSEEGRPLSNLTQEETLTYRRCVEFSRFIRALNTVVTTQNGGGRAQLLCSLMCRELVRHAMQDRPEMMHLRVPLLSVMCRFYGSILSPGRVHLYLNLISQPDLLRGMLGDSYSFGGYAVAPAHAQSGYLMLLLKLLGLLKPYLATEVPMAGTEMQNVYTATCQLLNTLRTDYPMFLVMQHFVISDAIPPGAAFIRNIVLSAVPPGVEEPHVDVNLRLDSLKSLKHVSIFSAGLSAIHRNQALTATLLELYRAAMRVGSALSPPLTPYIRTIIDQHLCPGGVCDRELLEAIGIRITRTNNRVSSQLVIVSALLTELSDEGRYLLMSGLCNELRYPNLYSRRLVPLLVMLARNEELPAAAREIIVRVVVERGSTMEPRPWALRVTLAVMETFMTELMEYLHTAPVEAAEAAA